MAVPTKQEMLDNVNTAINDYLLKSGVQSYTIGGRTVQVGNIDTLMKLRDQLTNEIALEAGSGRTYAKFGNPGTYEE